jgi:hypothetical protein
VAGQVIRQVLLYKNVESTQVKQLVSDEHDKHGYLHGWHIKFTSE